MAKTHLLAILSGGLDSAVSLALAKDLLQPERIGAVHFRYEQNHDLPEISSFRRVCDHYEIAEEDRVVYYVPAIGGSTLTHAEAPHRIEVPGVPPSYVPNRNMILIARAASHAIQYGFDALSAGMHEEDSAYPDCTAAFVNAMKRALACSTAGTVSFYAPVIKMSKAAIVRAGTKLGVPFELTWTCYDPQWLEPGQFVSCGKCPACKLRLSAFKDNGLRDPIPYLADLEAKAP